MRFVELEETVVDYKDKSAVLAKLEFSAEVEGQTSEGDR